MGAEMCDIKPRRRRSPSGAPARSASSRWPARACSAPKVIAIDREPYRLRDGRTSRATHDDQLRGRRRRRAAAGADRRPRPGHVHRRGRHGGHPRQPRACTPTTGSSRPTRPETDRPHALRAGDHCAAATAASSRSSASTAGFIDKFPMGALMNRALTIRTGQCHVQRYMKPLLEHIEAGEHRPELRHHAHRCRSTEAPQRLRHVQAQAGRLREGRAQALTRPAMTRGNHRPRARDATSHGPAAPSAGPGVPVGGPLMGRSAPRPRPRAWRGPDP